MSNSRSYIKEKPETLFPQLLLSFLAELSIKAGEYRPRLVRLLCTTPPATPPAAPTGATPPNTRAGGVLLGSWAELFFEVLRRWSHKRLHLPRLRPTRESFQMEL